MESRVGTSSRSRSSVTRHASDQARAVQDQSKNTADRCSWANSSQPLKINGWMGRITPSQGAFLGARWTTTCRSGSLSKDSARKPSTSRIAIIDHSIQPTIRATTISPSGASAQAYSKISISAIFQARRHNYSGSRHLRRRAFFRLGLRFKSG